MEEIPGSTTSKGTANTSNKLSPGRVGTTGSQVYRGTSNTGTTHNAADVTKESMKATDSEVESSTQNLIDEAPQADAEMLDAPRKQDDKAKEAKSRQSSKTRRLLDGAKSRFAAGKEKVTAFREQYPKTAKTIGGVAQVAGQHPFVRGTRITGRIAWGVIRSVDAEDIKKAKELAGEWGKDIRVYINDAKQKIASEEKAAKGKSFHQIHEAKREKTVRKLERKQQLLRYTNKSEKAFLVDEARFSNAEAIKETSERIKSVKNTPPSLEEAISKQTSQAPVKTNTDRLVINADELGKRYLAGSPGAKYDYYLYNANHHLGSNYFDLAKHPQRAIEFDRFAATRLYQDGFKRADVENAVRGGAFRSQFENSLNSKNLQEYDRRVFGDTIHNNSATEQVREKTMKWQYSQGKGLYDGKINPQEVDQRQTIRNYWQETNLKKAQTTRHQALEKLAAHNKVGGLSQDSSTDAQYLLEYGKWLKAGKIPNKEGEQVIATRLTIAGHSKEEVIEVLRNRSAHYNESSQKLDKKYGEIQKDLLESEKYLKEQQEIRKLRTDRNIPSSERRLDALQLSHEHREGVYQTTRHVMESRRSTSSPPPKPQQNSQSVEVEVDF